MQTVGRWRGLLSPALKRNLVVETFGRDILDLSERHREKAIESAFGYWRSAGFPYPQIAEPEIRREIELLCGTSPRWRYGKLISLSTVGLRLANAFHPQIWGVKGHGRSPIDCFHDNDRLRLALSKAPLFWPDRRCWNAQCVRSLMRIHHRTRVSNFRPVVARAVVERFSECGAVVLDFSAGYSGRLLGAVTLKRHYLGIDAAKAQVTGLRQTMSAIRNMVLGSGEFVHGCAEDVLALIRKESVNLVFTSPPFFRLERYSTEATQSYIRYQSYDEWKEKLINK